MAPSTCTALKPFLPSHDTEQRGDSFRGELNEASRRWLLLGSCLGSVASAAQLGTVVFPTSCASKVQPTIGRGLALLPSFQYAEAAQGFEAAAHR